MSQKDKLIKRLKSRPKDMTFDEIEALLNSLEYKRSDKGRTSGSRVIFESASHPAILMHKPHPRKVMLEYQIKQIIEILETEELI